MFDDILKANGLASPSKLFETDSSLVTRTILGYTHCLPIWNLPPHVHACFELHLVLSGCFFYEAHEEVHHLTAGGICITRPGEIHRMFACSDGNSEIIHLQFDTIQDGELQSVFQKTTARSVRSCQELIPVLQEAITELEQPGPLCQELVSSLIYQFLIRVGRRIWHVRNMINTLPGYTNHPGIVNLLWYLEHNCRHGLTLDELAHIAGMSRSALSHRFSEEMHISVCRHNQRLVMQKARMLVEDGRQNLSEIADLLGFPSPNYFSSAFKKYFGVPPSAFKA